MVQVNNNTPITLRVKFFKVGKLQYISHLDLVRTMMKIIVRAKLPLWYTEGFNPKPKLVFAAPLSIGTESRCEFMDIRLTEKMPPEEAIARLNANMTEEMQAIEAYYPEQKLTELRWLGYRIELFSPAISAASAEAAVALFDRPTLPVMKKGKRGIREVDIKPLIKEISVSRTEGGMAIDCILSADSANFLNPEHIVKLLRAELSLLAAEDLTSEHYTILRTTAHREDMSEFK